MAGHLLGVLEPSVVLQVNRDAGCQLWRPAATMYSFSISSSKVMHGHLVLLAAFFMESQPPARTIVIDRLDFMKQRVRRESGLQRLERESNREHQQRHAMIFNL